MQKIVGIVLGVLVSNGAVRLASGAGGFGVKKTSWQPLCEATDELKGIPADVTANLKTATGEINSMMLDSTRAAIYSQLKRGTKEAKRAIAISGYLLGNVFQGLKYLESTDIERGVDLAAKSAYLKGHIDEFLHVAAKTTRTNEHCLLATDGAQPAKFTGATLDGVNCPLGGPDEGSKRNKLTKLSSRGHSGAMPPTNGPGNEHQAASTYRCRLFTKSQTSGLAHSNGPVEDGITWAAGYYSLNTTADDPLTIADLRTNPAQPRTPDNAWQVFFTALEKAPNSQAPPYQNGTAALHSSSFRNEFLRQVNLEDTNGSKASQPGGQHDLFTSTQDSSTDSTIANILATKLPATIAGIDRGTALGDITAPGDLAAVLAALLLQTDKEIETLKKKLEAAHGRPDPISEPPCNTIKDESECNRMPTCSYNTTETDENKKCKLDTEKAKKKSVSATQSQTGGTETPAEKCKDKKKDDCKDGCKWEGETCKDSSILLNKKFALMVSAALVALLF